MAPAEHALMLILAECDMRIEALKHPPDPGTLPKGEREVLETIRALARPHVGQRRPYPEAHKTPQLYSVEIDVRVHLRDGEYYKAPITFSVQGADPMNAVENLQTLMDRLAARDERGGRA